MTILNKFKMIMLFFKNFPFQVFSIVFIVVGTILGAIGVYRDNKIITGLLEDNKKWGRVMDDKVEENSRLSQQILDVSADVKSISDENIQISRDVDSLVNDIKFISNNSRDMIVNTTKLTDNINENTESIKFFYSNNYSYLEKYFPIGYMVKRQNKSGRHFVRRFGKSLEYDSFEINLYEKGEDELHYVMTNHRFLENNEAVFGAMENGKVEGDIDRRNYKTLWILVGGFEIIEGYKLSLLLIDDDSEYTYAIGNVPNSILFPE